MAVHNNNRIIVQNKHFKFIITSFYAIFPRMCKRSKTIVAEITTISKAQQVFNPRTDRPCRGSDTIRMQLHGNQLKRVHLKVPGKQDNDINLSM